MESPRALYVHVPFCVKKCRYCDFFSVPIEGQPIERYIACLLRELTAWGKTSPTTVFVGGGTPTALHETHLQRLLDALHAADLYAVTEFTVEANPGTITPEKLRLLRRGGVNRLSLGVQSFHQKHLHTLGRIHSPQQAREAVELARAAGFDNLSVDLIFGIPGQSAGDWAADLDAALALEVEHLSAYGLTYEQGTPLHEALVAGRVKPVPPEVEREMALHTIRRARAAGLEHYEISNYARPGRQCRHNMTYWANDSHIGIGAAAVTYVDGERRRNVANVTEYIGRIECSSAAVESAAVESAEKLDPEARARETAVLALRTRGGVVRQPFAATTGFAIDSLFRTPVVEFVARGLLADDGERIALTDEGVIVADEISVCVV